MTPPPFDTAPPPARDTRERILRAALHLFRKRGYHGVGITEILEVAQAPKGSMYHHFPGGKESVGVAVIQTMTRGLIDVFTAMPAQSTEAQVLQAGAQMALGLEKTHHEICALFSGFVAERTASPLLGAALAEAYDRMVATLQERLLADGFAAAAAHDTALSVVMLLEGGSILSHTHQSIAPFRLAVRQAASLCRLPAAGLSGA